MTGILKRALKRSTGGTRKGLSMLEFAARRLVVVTKPRRRASGPSDAGTRVRFEALEARLPLASAFDFGDAPDTAAGTGLNNYETREINGGPSHVIMPRIFLGASVDADDGTLGDSRASADDHNGEVDDEDGVLDPLDLWGTVGASPTVTLSVTNTTFRPAKLYGWIDYDHDGVFEASEQAQIDVADDIANVRLTLTFRAIPAGSAGPTYARFRLSTDEAAANSTGVATDGEVEDYPFTITNASDGTVNSHVKIRNGLAGFAAESLGIQQFDSFGGSVAAVGDLNGDGVPDLAVGVRGDENTDVSEGALYVLMMNPNGTVKHHVKISDGVGGLTAGSLDAYDHFGSSVAALGDLNRDGVTDLAVGAPYDNDTGLRHGAAYVLMMNQDGTVKDQVKIGDGIGGLNRRSLDSQALFGMSVAALGDINGDGVADIAVGAGNWEIDRGAMYVLMLNADGTVKRQVKIADGLGGLTAGSLSPFWLFGFTMSSSGDLDGDGITDLALGVVYRDSTRGGAILVLMMNADGTVKNMAVISDGPQELTERYSPTSLAYLGDLDGDDVGDLAFGEQSHDQAKGAVHILLMNRNATIKRRWTIADGVGSLPAGTLNSTDYFGSSIAALGDLDGDAVIDLAVGAVRNSDVVLDQGAVHILNLRPAPVKIDYGDAPDPAAGVSSGNYQTLASHGGPSHMVEPRIFLGASVDGDDGTLWNSRANADDREGALDDEDGILSPMDLLGTVGASPTVTLLVTNTTFRAAKLVGWIDYNHDGQFNDSERAQLDVPENVTSARLKLEFPAIPAGSGGQTYARFRLSTDPAAASPTGGATDGEVEDYPFTIALASAGTVKSHRKTSGPFIDSSLDGFDGFGSAVAALGDVDGDGVGDLAVGAENDEHTLASQGAVYLLFMTGEGTVKRHVKISDGIGGLAADSLHAVDLFGSSLAEVGDLDGNGVPDLAVGAPLHDQIRGSIYTLLLNSDGTVKGQTRIGAGRGGLAAGVLAAGDMFGSSLANLGDLDGDGVADLAVGATGHADSEGAVYVLLMNSDGTVKRQVRISSESIGLREEPLANGDLFGTSLGALGDLDGDGVVDLAVGAAGDEGSRGAVYVLLLNSDGTVKRKVKIHDGASGLAVGSLSTNEFFGSSIAALGDFDRDGVNDLAVGAPGDRHSDSAAEGSIYLLRMNSDGTVKGQTKLGDGLGGVEHGFIQQQSLFGSVVARMDLNSDDVPDLAVGAALEGAVYSLNLAELNWLLVTSFAATPGGFTAHFGSELDTASLNIYGSTADDERDVVVQGESTGHVFGSLVVDSSAQKIEFVARGGPLTADTYSVILRSAAHGFTDLTGRLLDGDGDGTAGGDFRQSFTVDRPANDAVSIAVSDFVRGPGQNVDIPLSIAAGSAVERVEVHLSYDPSLLNISSAIVGSGLRDTSHVALDTSEPGEAIVTFTTTTGLPAESFEFVVLQAAVPAGAAANYRRQHVLGMQNLTVTDRDARLVPAIADDAVHLVSYVADVSGNGRVNAADAAEIARVASLLDPTFHVNTLMDPIAVGDISGNGRVNAADAALVARYAALFEVPQIPPVQSAMLVSQLGWSEAGSGLRPAATPQPPIGPTARRLDPARQTVARRVPAAMNNPQAIDLVLQREMDFAVHSDETESLHNLEEAMAELLTPHYARTVPQS